MWKVSRVAEWTGWCSPCGSADRPLVLTRSGPTGLWAWFSGLGDEDCSLQLTCRMCGEWQDVPFESDEAELLVSAELDVITLDDLDYVCTPAPVCVAVPQAGATPAGALSVLPAPRAGRAAGRLLSCAVRRLARLLPTSDTVRVADTSLPLHAHAEATLVVPQLDAAWTTRVDGLVSPSRDDASLVSSVVELSVDEVAVADDVLALGDALLPVSVDAVSVDDMVAVGEALLPVLVDAVSVDDMVAVGEALLPVSVDAVSVDDMVAVDDSVPAMPVDAMSQRAVPSLGVPVVDHLVTSFEHAAREESGEEALLALSLVAASPPGAEPDDDSILNVMLALSIDAVSTVPVSFDAVSVDALDLSLPADSGATNAVPVVDARGTSSADASHTAAADERPFVSSMLAARDDEALAASDVAADSTSSVDATLGTQFTSCVRSDTSPAPHAAHDGLTARPASLVPTADDEIDAILALYFGGVASQPGPPTADTVSSASDAVSPSRKADVDDLELLGVWADEAELDVMETALDEFADESALYVLTGSLLPVAADSAAGMDAPASSWVSAPSRPRRVHRSRSRLHRPTARRTRQDARDARPVILDAGRPPQSPSPVAGTGQTSEGTSPPTGD